MQYYENNKVGKFWDETECLEKETKEILAKKILSLRQICLEKLENQEWTIQEYNDFIYIVKRMKLSRFSRFYDLIILYLNLSKEDCLLEIEKLNKSGLIRPTITTNSYTELLAKSVNDFYGKILSLTSVQLTEAEKGDRLLDNGHKRVFYNDIMAQLKDPNSDYVGIIRETLKNMIELAVEKQEIKEELLKLETEIINVRINTVRSKLEIIERQNYIKKSLVSNTHCKQKMNTRTQIV